MAARVYMSDDLKNGIVAQLVAMLLAVLLTGGDVRRLAPAIAALQAQAMLYDLDWNEIIIQVSNQIKSASKRPPIESKKEIVKC